MCVRATTMDEMLAGIGD